MVALVAGAGLAAGAGSCGGPASVLVGPDYDPRVWTDCASEAGREALQQGEARLMQGDRTQALPLLRQAVERCPRLVRAHELYQDAALDLGGEAEAGMRRFYAELDDEPFRPELVWARARLLASNANRLNAVEGLIDRQGSFPYAHLSRARLLRDFEKYEEAVGSFQRAISLDNSLLDAHLELAGVQLVLSQHREARNHYESYVRGRPTDRTARRELVRLLLYDLEDPRAAAPHVEELLRVDPSDPDTLLDQAALHWRLGRPFEAREVYRAVLRQDLRHSRAVLNLANLYYEGLGSDEATRREYWPLAREAYRYYLALDRTEDGYDAFDHTFAVPYRLAKIEELLGPDDRPPPTDPSGL